MPSESQHPPQLIAHRGYAHRFPENTLLALREAVAVGARYIEFDIQLSADQVPVLLHDSDLQRTGGTNVNVFDTSAVELMRCAVGESDRFGDRFATERVPSLMQVVDWLAGQPQVTAFVEVKAESIQQFGAEIVHRAVWQVLEPVRSQIVLISYDDSFLFAARLAAPLPIGWVATRWDDDHARRARALGPDYLFVNWTRLPPAPAPLWKGSWRWAVYEVTDADLAMRLAERGIAFVESMMVGELLADPRLVMSNDRR